MSYATEICYIAGYDGDQRESIKPPGFRGSLGLSAGFRKPLQTCACNSFILRGC